MGFQKNKFIIYGVLNMRELAEVIECIDNNTAKVELIRTSACGDCKVCSSDKKIIITAKNNINAKVGDRVSLEVVQIKKTAIVFVYIVPLVLLFAGFYIGKLLFKEEIPSVLLSITLPTLYVIIAIILEKRKKNISSEIISIINE